MRYRVAHAAHGEAVVDADDDSPGARADLPGGPVSLTHVQVAADEPAAMHPYQARGGRRSHLVRGVDPDRNRAVRTGHGLVAGMNRRRSLPWIPGLELTNLLDQHGIAVGLAQARQAVQVVETGGDVGMDGHGSGRRQGKAFGVPAAAGDRHVRDAQPDGDGDVVLARVKRLVGLEGQLGPLSHLPAVIGDAGHLGEGIGMAVHGERRAFRRHRLPVEGEIDGLDHGQAQAPVVRHADLDAAASVTVATEAFGADDVPIEHVTPPRAGAGT
jgi:hypothetical protein